MYSELYYLITIAIFVIIALKSYHFYVKKYCNYLYVDVNNNLTRMLNFDVVSQIVAFNKKFPKNIVIHNLNSSKNDDHILTDIFKLYSERQDGNIGVIYNRNQMRNIDDKIETYESYIMMQCDYFIKDIDDNQIKNLIKNVFVKLRDNKPTDNLVNQVGFYVVQDSHVAIYLIKIKIEEGVINVEHNDVKYIIIDQC